MKRERREHVHMTIKNRESFLNHVAEQLGRKRRTKVTRPTWSVQPQLDVHKDLSQDELIDVLKKQCEVIHTQFKRTTTDQLSHVLKETIQAYQGKSIVIPKDKRNDQYGLTSFFNKLQLNGLDIHLWDGLNGKEHVEFAEQADIGITFSDLTLAESGTVTLFHNKANGRTLSLLPQSYIAIIPSSTLVPRFTQAAQFIRERRKNGEDVPSCVSFVSGPSNSADIEMNLIVGVHGPVAATYIVVDP